MKTVAPCEGTGYETGSVSLVRGGKNPEAARRFVRLDALGRGPVAHRRRAEDLLDAVEQERQGLAQAPKLAEIKLIAYDTAKYGSSAERVRLLRKWDAEVKSQPK